MKKSILNLIAKIGESSALKAAGTASYWGYCQPKEPKALEAHPLISTTFQKKAP